MPNEAAIDTDILLKSAAYRLAGEVVEVVQQKGTPAVLGLTHLIANKQLKRKRGLKDLDGARAELQKGLALLGHLEPDGEEIALAAELATDAQARSLSLDAGEAQLAAIVARRGLPLLATGDKRALAALAALLEDGPIRAALVGRLACFEQIIEAIAEKIGDDELRSRVCAEPEVDGAMRMACSCGRDPWDPAQLHEACASFANAIREQVDDLLVKGSMLA